MNGDEKAVFLERARSVVERNGFDPEYYLVEDSAKHADYYFYSRDTHDQKNLIFVEYGYSRPEVREISEVSAAVRGLQEGYRAQRVCFPAELRNEIEALYRP